MRIEHIFDKITPARIVMISPLVFVVHVLEEAPEFVSWFNSLVEPDISQQSFVGVNITAFIITTVVAVAAATTKRLPALLTALAWLSFLMFANAILHIVGTIVHGYSPGAVTAAALYLPYFAWIFRSLQQSSGVSILLLATITMLAGLPMLIHGYLIVFEGGRLF